MNIIEHPFATLGKNEALDAIIYHEWETEHPLTNQTVKAWWRVEGSPELGLPTPSDERVYLVLMEMTREVSFENQMVPFTRHDLIKRLGWPVNQQSYKMVEDAFIRLKGVTITAKNAFWNPRVRSFSTVGFNIIDAYEIFNEKPGRKSKASVSTELPLSYFKWSDVMFQSFQDGYIRSIDLHLALSLKRPLSLRLCRYLGKKAYRGRSSFEISLRDLCEYHLGMTVDGRFDSKLKMGLRPAHEELVERGVLQGVSYTQMKSKKGEKVCYVFPPPNSPHPSTKQLVVASDGSSKAEAEEGSPATESLPSATSLTEDGKVRDLLRQVLELGVSPDVAQGLLSSVSYEALRLQLDCLADRKPRDPAALFLYAVRQDLAPPPTYLERAARERQREAEQAQEARPPEEVEQAKSAAARARADQELVRRQLGTATAFYEGLCDEAKALVRHQVSHELRQGGVKGRWQYPQPLWMEVLCGLLRDSAWKEPLERMREALPQVSQEAEDSQDEGEDEAILVPSSLFARLDLYADTLREMVRSGEVKAQALDSIKERAFPLLDTQEW